MTPEIALSVRQPWAELIMRGIKTIEVRSLPLRKRGRVHIYASKWRDPPLDEGEVSAEDNIESPEDDIVEDALPRGVLVGTVELVDCRRVCPADSEAAGFEITVGSTSFGWHLARPVRATKLRAPKNRPQPRFFRPF